MRMLRTKEEVEIDWVSLSFPSEHCDREREGDEARLLVNKCFNILFVSLTSLSLALFRVILLHPTLRNVRRALCRKTPDSKRLYVFTLLFYLPVCVCSFLSFSFTLFLSRSRSNLHFT